MEKVVVNIGSKYEVIADYGKYLKAGEVWYAWFYGQLVLCEVGPDGKTFTGVEMAYPPHNLIKAIKAGKVKEVVISE